MKFNLRAGQQVDLLSPDEHKRHLTDALDKVVKEWFQEEARGMSTARFTGWGTVNSGNVTAPATGEPTAGPGTGFAWAVQRVTATNLAANDVLSLYRNAVTGTNRIGQMTSAAPMLTFGSKGLILRAEEILIANGTGLTATGDIIINGEGVEVPELDLYKLL